MMPAMTGRYLAGLVAVALLAPLPAAAQFYDLDGAYRCLVTPDQSCEKDLKDQPAPPPPPPAGPTLEQIIAKVRANTAGPHEIELLEKRAAVNDPRAVEVLAWCKLNGIGGPPDPVAAYWLYRQGASLGVANARQNQIAVFETKLTSEQRQQVLARENAPSH
jgi:TPR repeat protein